MRPAKISKRVRRVWLSAGATLLLTGFLGLFVLWIDQKRNTDLADGRVDITSWSRDEELARESPIRFQDVAREWQLVMRHGPGRRRRVLTEDTGSGVAWGDYDNDGDWDLYFVNFAGDGAGEGGGANRLFRNDGGRFEDVTEQAGVADPEGFGMGAWFVDFDGDGDQDLFVTNYGPNRLFENQGDGTFVDVAEQAGVADDAWSTGAAFGDFDGDGHLDIYVCNYVQYVDLKIETRDIPASQMGSAAVPFTLNPNSFDAAPNRLYRNQGDGTFVDVAEMLGVANPQGRSLEATFCDLDGDGWLDLYVNNDVSANKLYRNPSYSNIQDGADLPPFEDRSLITGTADTRGSMGLSVGAFGWMDDNPDGLPDLFITHWVAQENALYVSLKEGGMLFYQDKTRQFGLAEVSTNAVGWGAVVADFDADGRDDIAVANGSTLEAAPQGNERPLKKQAPFVFWNRGDLFVNVAAQAGPALTTRYSARGLAAADFDNDGDLDIAVSVNRGSPLLLRNDTVTTNRSIKIRLDGPAAACWGARVELTVGDTTQVRWLGSDASFLSMHAPELIFGLGKAKQVDRIEVHWADRTITTIEQISEATVVVRHGK